MKLAEAVKGFLLSMSADGLSTNTIEIYRHHLGQLSDHLSNPELAVISSADIVGFYAYLRTDYVPHRLNGNKEPLKPATLNNAWCSFRSFYNWATETLSVDRPDKGIKRPKWQAPIVQPFNVE